MVFFVFVLVYLEFDLIWFLCSIQHSDGSIKMKRNKNDKIIKSRSKEKWNCIERQTTKYIANRNASFRFSFILLHSLYCKINEENIFQLFEKTHHVSIFIYRKIVLQIEGLNWISFTNIENERRKIENWKLKGKKKEIGNSPSSMDFSADDNWDDSYFNPVWYCCILSISRCRPWTNWNTPHIPIIQNNKCRTFADLTIPNKPQSISIMCNGDTISSPNVDYNTKIVDSISLYSVCCITAIESRRIEKLNYENPITSANMVCLCVFVCGYLQQKW